MTIPVEQLSMKPTRAAGVTTLTGSTARTLGDWRGDVINVRDFGATGNGSTNDRAAIQAAFDAAFGPATAPNAGTSSTDQIGASLLNRAVYFPAGHYMAQTPIAAKSITSVTQNAGGTLRYVTSTAHGQTTGNTVVISGIAQTAGHANQVNGTRVITVINSTTFDTIRIPAWDGTASFTYTNARVMTPSLLLTNVAGAHIFGAGPYSTTIEDNSGGSILIASNGFQYSQVENLALKNVGLNSVCFLSDMDGDFGNHQGFQGVTVNTFDSMTFVGDTTNTIGLDIGFTNNSQADAHQIRNCMFQNTAAGIRVGKNFNQNSLGHNVFGCNFIANTYAIYAAYGSIPVICGSLFEVTNVGGYDIFIENGSYDGCAIIGCRSESNNFVYAAFQDVTIIGCTQTSPSPNVGVDFYCNFGGNGSLTIIGGTTTSGVIDSSLGGTISGFSTVCSTSNWLRNSGGAGTSYVQTRDVRIGGTKLTATGTDYPWGTWVCPISSGAISYVEGMGTAKVKAGAFAAADIPQGTWMVGRDTSGSTTKLYYNNAGTLMSVALT